MINRKPSDPFKMVLINDPGLIGASEEFNDHLKLINTYMTDRDLKHFTHLDTETGIVKNTGEKVTVVTIVPLRSDCYYLLEGGMSSIRKIVEEHVIGTRNYDGVVVTPNTNGKPHLPQSSLDNIDLESMNEIASVIISRAQGRDGEDRAFFSQDFSSRKAMLQNLQLPANSARVENARSTKRHSESGPEKTPDAN